jgi:hypothetical protein
MEAQCTCQGTTLPVGRQPRRLYHVATIPAFSVRSLFKQNACQAAYFSSPSKSTMQSPEIRSLKSCSSSFSAKAAVSGMKSLLPLKLSNTTLSVPELHSSSPPFTPTTIGLEDPPTERSPRSKKLSHRGRYFPQIPLVIRPEHYRDIRV